MHADENYTSSVVEATKGGLLLRVYATPGASRNQVVGIYNGALKVTVSAAPEKGKANQAICKFLAAQLGVKRAQLAVHSGESTRMKRIRIDGLRRPELESRLRAVTPRPGDECQSK